MTVAIVFHSKYGQTKKIAQRIDAVLKSSGCRSQLIDVDTDARAFRIDAYRAVLIGGPL